MEIHLVDNIENKLVNFLDPALAEAKKARLAVAFMKHSGLALIEGSLRECLGKGGEVEILVGLDFRTTEPKVLKMLLQLASEGFSLRCYCFSEPSVGDTPVYHPKLYLLSDDEKARIIVGSSNLTAGGLKDNVEANLILIAGLEEEIVSDAYGLYNRLKFQQKRFEPDLEYIEKYEEAYEVIQRKSFQALQEKRTRRLIKELKEKEKALPKPKPTIRELFGWQKLVYEKLPLGTFKTSDIYVYEEEFQKHYPENRNIKPKIRQVLQDLRDMGLLKYPRRETWIRL